MNIVRSMSYIVLAYPFVADIRRLEIMRATKTSQSTKSAMLVLQVLPTLAVPSSTRGISRAFISSHSTLKLVRTVSSILWCILVLGVRDRYLI